MHQLTVIGLGAADFDQLQMGVYKKLKEAGTLYVRTLDHPVLRELENEGLVLQSFDAVYEKHDTFEPVYTEIAETLIEKAHLEPIMYAVPGHPLVAEQTVQNLIAAERMGRVQLKIEGGQRKTKQRLRN